MKNFLAFSLSDVVIIMLIRDLFHVYLSIFEFHFLRLHINESNKFCFFMFYGRVPGMPNRQYVNLKHSNNTVPLYT